MRFRRALLIVCCVLAAGPAAADWAPARHVDAYLTELARHDLVHGSLAISEKGEPRYQRAFGFAVIEPGRHEAADTGTRYRIGPVTRLFTATLTMQLAERASITLDSRLAEFFPDLPNALEIRYRDLLMQRSGLADYTRMPDFDAWRLQPHSRADLLAYLGQTSPAFAPGERVEGNDTNYLVLALVLEKVLEKPFDDILRAQIASRIGLARTYQGDRADPARHEALAYVRTPRGWERAAEADPALFTGASGMMSAPQDLVRFTDLLFAGRVLSAHNLDILRGAEGGEGPVLPTLHVAGRRAYGIAGRIDGYYACVYHFPDSRLTVAYTSNASDLPPEDLVAEVLALLFDRKRRPPKMDAGAVTPAG